MSESWFTLQAVNEWVSHDPVTGASDGHCLREKPSGPVIITAPRNGYGSFRLLVRGIGTFNLEITIDGDPEVDVHKVWYHHMNRTTDDEAPYRADALVPVTTPGSFSIPDPENKIADQMYQEFWIDVFAPKGAQTGQAKGDIKLACGSHAVSLPFVIDVLSAVVPEEPTVTMDNNSYGSRWLPELYPEAYSQTQGRQDRKYWETSIELLHNYYRLAHEHRAIFHNLGAGHSGDFDPIYGPSKSGQGRELTIGNWDLFDHHYGPLLDGTAFASAAPGAPRPRRPAEPIWGVYTPINPVWPADYLWWGEKGYEEEMVGGLKAFDAHFRQKGWTKSRVEFFFNHKKRYRWFEWDGDEQKYYKDFAHHREMIRLWEIATEGSPVNWVYRADASWYMKKQFEELAGHRNFWVAGSFLRWYPADVRQVIDRGETIWTYGSYPSIREPASTVLYNLYTTWARGLHGFAPWQVTSPGRDPWFDNDGASIGAFYPGERFGIPGPIPSIRMKVLRNGIQDLDLLSERTQAARDRERVTAAVAESLPVTLWEDPPEAVRTLPPEDWDGNNLSADHEPTGPDSAGDNLGWWSSVRDIALGRNKR
jgi:hypothetical protein